MNNRPYNPNDLLTEKFSFVGTRVLNAVTPDTGNGSRPYLKLRYALYRDQKTDDYFAVNLDDPSQGCHIGKGVEAADNYCGIHGERYCDRFIGSFSQAHEAVNVRDVLQAGLNQAATKSFISAIKDSQAFKDFNDYVDALRFSIFGKVLDEEAKKKGDSFFAFLNELDAIKTPQQLKNWVDRLNDFSNKFDADLQPRENKLTLFGYTLRDYTAANKEATKSYGLLDRLKAEINSKKVGVLPDEGRSYATYQEFNKKTFAEWYQNIEQPKKLHSGYGLNY